LLASAATQLLSKQAWSESRWSLAHFRDRNGLEAGVVIQYADGRVALVEVKATQTYRSAGAA
jgi:hypothetical protein